MYFHKFWRRLMKILIITSLIAFPINIFFIFPLSLAAGSACEHTFQRIAMQNTERQLAAEIELLEKDIAESQERIIVLQAFLEAANDARRRIQERLAKII
jgi:hypothetical protein